MTNPAPELPPAASSTPPTAAGGAPRVVGVDLSLTSTGVASSLGWTQRIRSNGHRADTLHQRHERLDQLAKDVIHAVGTPNLVVIEGPSFGSQGAGTWDRAGLWWIVVDRLHRTGHTVVEVPPKTRSLYATGAGNASKDKVMLAVAERYRHLLKIEGNDEADAFCLAAMGADALGHPLAAVPKSHRAALDKVAWPDLTVEVP